MVDHVEITKEKIVVDKVTDLVSSPVCGATSVFIGQGDNFNYFFFCFFLTLVLLNSDMPCLFKQCRSRSVGFFRSPLI